MSVYSTDIDYLYEACGRYFGKAERTLERIVPSCTQYVSAYMLIAEYVCYKSMLTALPQLDIVLTRTGFGVVSNSTLAPASRERVDALSKQLAEAAAETVYTLLDVLFMEPDYVRTCERYSLLDVPSAYTAYVADDPSGYLSSRPRRKDIMNRLSRRISRRQVDALIYASAVPSESEPLQEAVSMARAWESAVLCEQCSAEELLCELEAYMESRPDTFAGYLESAEYRSRKDTYENSAGSSAYFFMP